MKAALLFGKEDLRVQDMPVPQVAAGELLLRVKAAAVCGTDIRMFRNGARGVGPDSPTGSRTRDKRRYRACR